MYSKTLFVFLALIFILTSSCVFAPPFKGPKYDAKTKSLTLDPNREVILALTNATLERKKRGGFDSRSKTIFQNLESYEGYIGGTVRVEIFGDEVWTMTVWENEAALQNFVNSTRHLDAMYMTNQAMKKFRHFNVKVLAKNLPLTWEQAQLLLNSKEMKDHISF